LKVRLSRYALAVAVLWPQPAFAQSMNAEDFYRSATNLQKKGATAIFSLGKIRTLTAEGKAAGEKAREARLAALAAGKAPRYCPPDGPASMGSSEFMTRLSAIPASERARIDMTEAMTRILETKFPCKPKG
jgi:hypothetical protein